MAKQLNTRIQQKYDTRANWTTAGENGFTPLKGEVIIYSDGDKEGATAPAMKIGDGDTTVDQLPFVSGDVTSDVKINLNIGCKVFDGVSKIPELADTLTIEQSTGTGAPPPTTAQYTEGDDPAIYKEQWGTVSPRHSFTVGIAGPSDSHTSTYYNSELTKDYCMYTTAVLRPASYYNTKCTYTLSGHSFLAEKWIYDRNSSTMKTKPDNTTEQVGGYTISTISPTQYYYKTRKVSIASSSSMNFSYDANYGTGKLSKFKLTHIDFMQTASGYSSYLKIEFSGHASTESYNYGYSQDFTGYIKVNQWDETTFELTSATNNTYFDNDVDAIISAITSDLINIKYASDTNTYTVDTLSYFASITDSTLLVAEDEEEVCLIEGTLITMADGSSKAIENVKSGDLVLSYDPNTKQQTETMVLSCFKSGQVSDFELFRFSDGRTLTCYGIEPVYDLRRGHPIDIHKIDRRATLLNVDNEKIRLTEAAHYHTDVPKRIYSILSTGNSLYVNGILKASHAYRKYEFVTQHRFTKYIPEQVLAVWKTEQDRYTTHFKARTNPDFIEETKTIVAQKARSASIIKINKQKLTDTDYRVQKYIEGVITQEEFEKYKQERAQFRKNINDQEETLKTATKDYNDILRRYRGGTFKELFEDCCKQDHELLETLKEFVESNNGQLLP